MNQPAETRASGAVIALSDSGSATVLSYNVPEPTSYPGRNYMLLDLPDYYWRTDIVGSAPTAPAPAARPIKPPIGGADEGPGPVPPIQLRLVHYSFVQPTGDVSVTSNSYPLSVVVSFGIGVDNLDNLRVVVDGNDGPALAPHAGGPREYAATVTLKPGKHSLTVRGDSSQIPAWVAVGAALSVTVTATPTPAPPPDITVTKPANNAEVTLGTDGTGTLPVEVSASSKLGMKSLTVELDGEPVNALSGNASSLSGTVTVTGLGSHTLTFTAIDEKGNPTSVRETILAKSATLRASRFKLVIVECMELSSFLGAYGVGRVLKTFSLLPGEKTKINIDSYNSSTTTSDAASSILDSYTQDASEAFEQDVKDEQSSQTQDTEEAKNVFDAKAGASWGFGSVQVSDQYTSGSTSARDDMVKNVRNATSKHAAKASSKRNVTVKSSTDTTDTTKTTTTIDREISNINVSRTLNFVFRQMNQEFITMLHLVDVRFRLMRWDDNGNGGWDLAMPVLEFTLPQLESMLGAYLDAKAHPEYVGQVQAMIFAILDSIYPFDADHDAAEHPVSIVEQVEVTRIKRDANGYEVHDQNGNPEYAPSGTYFRFREGMTSTYTGGTTGTRISVPGVLLSADTHVMRTDGVVVDAVLGQGDALDDYNHLLQVTAAEARSHDNRTAIVANELSTEKVHRLELARSIVEAAPADQQADVFGKLFPRTVVAAPTIIAGSTPIASGGSDGSGTGSAS